MNIDLSHEEINLVAQALSDYRWTTALAVSQEIGSLTRADVYAVAALLVKVRNVQMSEVAP
jgi:hypothetical protein